MNPAITAETSSMDDGSGTEVTSITVAENELPKTGPTGVIDNTPWSVPRPGPATPSVQAPVGQNHANPFDSVTADLRS
jgi:hypothetical protein